MRRAMLALAMASALAAHGAYKCKDERGVTLIGDTPPAGCANVVMYEISRTGAVLRKIDPTPTPEQLKARQEEAERAKEAAKAAAEQRRKDLALLATYSSEKEFDTSRDINLEPVDLRIKSAHERAEAVDKRIKELDDEMDFYRAGKSAKSKGKGREAPLQLISDLARARKEKESLQAAIAGYEKEKVEIRERYAVDKKRWVELKKLHREGKLDLRDPKEIEAARKGTPQKPAVKKYNLYLVPAN